MVQKEAAQHLVQRPVHLEPGRRTHQPLQQMLELLGHTLQRRGCHPVTRLGTLHEPEGVKPIKGPRARWGRSGWRVPQGEE